MYIVYSVLSTGLGLTHVRGRLLARLQPRRSNVSIAYAIYLSVLFV